MNWCQPHWNQLREAIAERGLDKFGAQTGEQAASDLKAQIEGKTTDFDPLMGSWSRINQQMLESAGLRALTQCPLCILVEDGQPHLVKNWIDGVTDSALNYALKEGLIKQQ
jgi:hypothetical protein